MILLQLVILLVIGLVLAATLADFIRLDDWWVRVFDFPRQQIVILGSVVLIGYGAWFGPEHPGHAAIILLLVASLVHQVRRIYPYTPLARKQVADCRDPDRDHQLSLLVSNVLMENRRAPDLVRLVAELDPDVLLVLEPDDWWNSQLRILEADYPYHVRRPLDNRYGMSLYSRLELDRPRVRDLVEKDVPSIHTGIRLRSGHLVRLYCLHPAPPIPPENDNSVERDAELLLVGREIAALQAPAIVAGDLNDVAWSRTTALFQKISGLLDPRRGRGFYSTFHARYPFMRWPLDHVFHSHDFTLVSLRRLPGIGSDHFPIHVELRLNPKAPAWQEEPEPEAGDLEWAADKIAEVRRDGP